VQIRPYFPPVLKDIRLLHWIMRNQFFKEINSVMVGDSLEKRVCLKSKVWKMPFFCTKDSVSWAVDGAAEAVFDRMFGVRKSTAQVYDDMYSNGVPVEGRDDARVLILGDRKVEFEHFPEGLRFMSAA